MLILELQWIAAQHERPHNLQTKVVGDWTSAQPLRPQRVQRNLRLGGLGGRRDSKGKIGL